MGFFETRASHPGKTVVLVLLLLSAGLGLRQAPIGTGEQEWPIGEPVPIPVEGEIAEFSIPTPTPNSRVLVVVSALARGQKPFAMRLEATSSGSATRPLRANDTPSALPRPPLPPLPSMPPEPFLVPPATRVFSILSRDGDPSIAANYRSVPAHLRALGRRVQVYVDDRDLARVTPETLRDIVSTFDTHVFPTAARLFGPSADVDGDGRFTVLLTGWLDRLAEGRLPVDGFVRGSDFDRRIAAPFGNQTDMLYLSANLSSGPYLRTVLAHEYTHAVTFSRKVADPLAAGQPAADEEGWLDEALAHLVEDVHAFSRENLDYRVSAFLSAPERYRLVVIDYYLAKLFRSHGNRGATYSFLRWCSDQFGPGLLAALVRSPRTGVENLETATGRSFASLYREWSCALFLDSLKPQTSPESTDALILGPRPVSVQVDGAADVWSSAPTSSHYVIVDPSPSGFARIRVEGAPGSRLQVSAARLPEDLPSLDLSASLKQDPSGAPILALQIRHQGGPPVRLSALSFEPLVPPARTEALAPHVLRATDLAKVVERLDLEFEHPTLSSRLPLPRSLVSAGSPIVVKLLALDSQGRRISAWVEVNTEPRKHASMQSVSDSSSSGGRDHFDPGHQIHSHFPPAPPAATASAGLNSRGWSETRVATTSAFSPPGTRISNRLVPAGSVREAESGSPSFGTFSSTGLSSSQTVTSAFVSSTSRAF